MTTHAATAPSTTIRSRHPARITAPAAAGLAFAAAWAAGLVAWPSNLDVAASGAKVVSTYAGHQGVAVTQYLLVEGVDRMDGVKMLALATMALAGVGLARRGDLVPRWLGGVGAALAAAMIASGVGCLLLNNTLAQTAAVSLGLLLIWVAATGMTVGRRGR
jgi:hypothetical protein